MRRENIWSEEYKKEAYKKRMHDNRNTGFTERVSMANLVKVPKQKQTKDHENG